MNEAINSRIDEQKMRLSPPLRVKEKSQNWYFTFGFGQPHEGYYRVFKGTFSQARKKMFEAHGQVWSFQYSEKDWILKNGKTQAEEYGYKELR